MQVAVCKGCGATLTASEGRCPSCDTPLSAATEGSAMAQWEQELKRIKLHWVVVVILFWLTCLMVVGMFFIHGSAYFSELILIAAIFMVLGVYLKSKVLYLQRRGPSA